MSGSTRGSGSGSGSRRGSSGGRGGDNDDDDDDYGGMPPDFRNLMMQLMMSGAAGPIMMGGGPGGRRGRRQEEEVLTAPSPVKCPQCLTEHEYAPAPAFGIMKYRYSHNARVLWHNAKCPVCLEEKDPPVVNLQCGHPLCAEHFERLNGKIGEDAMLSTADQLEREREERRNRRNEENDDDDDEDGAGGDMNQLFEALMRSGIAPPPGAFVATGGGGPAGFLPNSDQLMDLVMRDMAGGGDDDDDDDDEDQYSEDESDYEDMPPLIPSAQRGTAAAASSSASAGAAAAAASGGSTSATTASSRSNRSGSNTNNRRSSRGGTSARSNNNNNNASSSSSNNRSSAARASNNNTSNRNRREQNEESSSSDDDMPPLIQRASNNNNNNTSNRGRTQQQQNNNNDSESDDSDGPPPLSHRSNYGGGGGTGAGDESSDSSNDDMPDLLVPDEDDSSDGEEDSDEMPDLVARDVNAVESDDDDDDDDDDIPDLLPRGQDDDTCSDSEGDAFNNHSTSSANSSDEDSDMPGLVGRGTNNNRLGGGTNRNRRRRNRNASRRNRNANRPPNDDSSQGGSDESIPGLIPRAGNNDRSSSGGTGANRRNNNGSFDSGDSSDDSSDDESMPDLLVRDQQSDDDDSNATDSDGSPEPDDVTPPAAASRASASASASTSARVGPPAEVREQWLQEELTKARRMKPSELKRKLRNMNVDTTTFFEKPELVSAYAGKMVERRVENYNPTAAEAAAATTAAAAAAAAPAPPPVDPYADMPTLLPAEDAPPKNGIWLLAPASSSSGSRHDDRVVLHYAYVHGSRVKSVQRGFFPKGSTIVSAQEGIIWIYAPSTSAPSPSNPPAAASARASSTTANNNNDSWDLHCVRDVHSTLPMNTLNMYTFKHVGAESASLVADGRGAFYLLLPNDPNNVSTCDRTLFRINSQYEQGKKVLDRLVPCHSRLYRDGAGGVWIHVPNRSQNSSGVTTRTNEDSERLSPGIWYITPFSADCVVSQVSPQVTISLDGSRTGLLLLSPNQENEDEHSDDDDNASSTSLLVHIGPSGELHRRTIPVNFANVQTVLDDADNGALVHCRNRNNRWKLCRVPWEDSSAPGQGGADDELEEFIDCPGRTKVVTDGNGGVWLWKKVGKSSNRAVSYVSPSGNLTEKGERFPGGTIMEG